MLKVLLLLLLFLPSVTFGLLTAEVFPWGVLFAVFYLRRFSYYIILSIALLFFSSVWLLFQTWLVVEPSGTDVIRSLAAYVNVILVAQTILTLNREVIETLVDLSRKIFWFLIVLGFVQYVGSDTLGYVIQFLIPRGGGAALTEMNRGVTLLSSEPARAGVELTLIYLINRLSRPSGKVEILTDLFLIIYQLVIIKSASGLAFTLGSLFIVHAKLKFDYRTAILLCFVLPFSLVAGYFILPNLGGRAAELLSRIADFDNLGDALFYVANESGNRLIALYSFFLSGVSNPFGFGVGAWPSSSMQALIESGLDYRDFRFFDVVTEDTLRPFRGPGVISNLLLDIGLIGTLAFFWLFYRAFRIYGRFDGQVKSALWVFLFKIALFGSPGNPIVVVFFVTVFRYINSNGYKGSKHDG